MKLITFSVYGADNKYLNGLLQNYELVECLYPDWYLCVFIDNTVPSWFTKILTSIQRIITIDMTGTQWNKRTWRFLPEYYLPGKPIERFIVRDADSRVSKRESDAVSEWIRDDKILHIMRDQPGHKALIMAGLWGFKTHETSKEIVSSSLQQFTSLNGAHKDHYAFDQMYLEYLYHTYKLSRTIHAAFNRYEEDARTFPTLRVENSFCGEIFDSENRPWKKSETIEIFNEYGPGDL